jgi:hypothetical protein
MKLGKYDWNLFGKLKGDHEDGRFYYIDNEDGGSRKISKADYRDTVSKIKKQIQDEHLIGKLVEYRTSKNSRDWPSDEWFSAIRLAKTDSSSS